MIPFKVLINSTFQQVMFYFKLLFKRKLSFRTRGFSTCAGACSFSTGNLFFGVKHFCELTDPDLDPAVSRVKNNSDPD
jgi:hypothetical protein